MRTLKSAVKRPSLIVAALVSLPFCVHAAINDDVSLGELIDFVEKEGKNSIENYAATQLIDSLAGTNFQIQSGELVDVVKYPDSKTEKIKSICTKFRYTDMESRVTVNSFTKFSLTTSDIDKPLVFKASPAVTASYTGRIHVEKGHEIGGFFGIRGCNWAASIKFSKDIKASVAGQADLSLTVNMNPSKQVLSDGRMRYQIEPTLTTKGKMINIGTPRFQVVQGGVAGQVIDKLDELAFLVADNDVWDLSLSSYIDEWLVNDQALQVQVEKRNKAFTESLAQNVLGSEYSAWSYGQPIVKTFDMPVLASEFLEDTIDFIVASISNYEHHFPISYEFLQDDDVREQLYKAIIKGDSATISTVLRSSLACEYAMDAARSMKIAQTSVYSDSITPAEYCLSMTGDNARNLGSASDITKSAWMLSPATTLDIGAKSIKNNYQPYMQRVRYKTVRSKQVGSEYGYSCSYDQRGNAVSCGVTSTPKYAGDGYCELELRVYKKNPTATNLKPLMAIHGGSWLYRGFGFAGMESMVSHFTDRGYAVFAPFYRLVGSSDGNTECNKANGKDIVADIKDALAWVEQNKASYGASGKVKLFGQSAGAHLAEYLAVHKKNQIDRAWLMYPPTDFADYIVNWNSSLNANGKAGVEGFMGKDIETLRTNLNDSFIKENSFPDWVANSPASYPPVFVMHGKKDDLVPSRQAERLCTAYGGSGSYSSTNSGGYKGVNNCGNNGSKLHLFKEAGHILDLACIDRGFTGGQLCPAGSYYSERAIEASIDEGLTWLGNSSSSTAN